VRPSQILNQGTIHADIMQRRPSQTQNGSKKHQLASLISGRSKVKVTPFSITIDFVLDIEVFIFALTSFSCFLFDDFFNMVYELLSDYFVLDNFVGGFDFF
jgi:hypothetical protein